MIPEIAESIGLREQVRQKWSKANRQTRLRMLREALRFSLTTIGFNTHNAELLFSQGRLPILKRERLRFQRLMRYADNLKSLDYHEVNVILKATGLNSKSSFTLALLGDNEPRAICIDRWWLRLYFNKQTRNGSRQTPEITDICRLLVAKTHSVNDTWIQWFESMGREGHDYHRQVLKSILNC